MAHTSLLPLSRPRTLRIAIVENHEDTLTSLTRYLESQGHQVDTATCMREGIDLLSDVLYDVLISDIGLPDGDGWELLCHINPPPATYAVAMSGYCSKADQEKSLAVGYRRHLTKPFTPADIDVVLEAARMHHAQPGLA